MADTDFFKYGAKWLRADFHLHTQADKEFKYSGELGAFFPEYIQRLKDEAINLGVITNHNKFDLEEFKTLKKQASKEGIWLLPGVELSVNDGGNGIHCLIVFDYDSWYQNNTNYIDQFLVAAFEGIPNRENENTRCKYSLKDVLEKLQEHRNSKRNSFIVMAHVEQKSGLWEEMDGGRLGELGKDQLFRSFVLGFQKMRTRDKEEKVKAWFGGWMPARLEGSDCKSIAAVGKAHTQGSDEAKCFVRLGEFGFDSLRLALVYHSRRVRTSNFSVDRIHINKLILNPETDRSLHIPLNSGLNCLVGVRGGGKSSILEVLRFALDIDMDANDPKRGNDYKYKNDIAKRLIGNGGKAVVYLVDNEQNLQYRIERMHDGKTHIFDKAGIELGGKRVSDILHVAYFGQKDLEEFGKDFGQGLIENKLLSRELVPTKDATKAKKIEILAALQTKEVLLKDFQSAEKLREELAELKKLKDQYEKYNLKEKLELITQYDSEEDFIDRSVQAAKEMVTELKKLIARQDKDLFAILGHKAAVEKELIDVEFNSAIAALQAELTSWIEALDPESKSSPVNILINTQQRFQEAFAEKQQEFEEIKRTIADPDINVETFREVERNFTKKTEALSKYSKIEEQLKEVNDLLRELLTDLKACWRAEHEFVSGEVGKFNASVSTMRIEVNHLGARNEFQQQLEHWLSGTRLQEYRYTQLSEKYSNGIDLYLALISKDPELERILQGGSFWDKTWDYIHSHLEKVLTYRTPDSYRFFYLEKPLEKYSLGQKATALMAFILSHQSKDLFLIDQPEDDLDNQTVAEQLIGNVEKTKNQTQYVFATHNPNIVVLGDSDQVMQCSFEDNKLTIKAIGSIDAKGIQETIVNVMEGGIDALERRTRFYDQIILAPRKFANRK